MTEKESTIGQVIDYITGISVPLVGAEANRQSVERYLVETGGYERSDVMVDVPIRFEIEGQAYSSAVDLVVRVNGAPYMAIKCAAGSLDSREREILSAARLLDDVQVPVAVVSDGATALVWETVSGRLIGKQMADIPAKADAERSFDPDTRVVLPEDHRYRQRLIFRSYDSMNVNIARKGGAS